MAENEGEVCLEEEVERLRRSGMSGVEISRTMGVDQAWVETLLSIGAKEPPPKEIPPEIAADLIRDGNHAVAPRSRCSARCSSLKGTAARLSEASRARSSDG